VRFLNQLALILVLASSANGAIRDSPFYRDPILDRPPSAWDTREEVERREVAEKLEKDRPKKKKDALQKMDVGRQAMETALRNLNQACWCATKDGLQKAIEAAINISIEGSAFLRECGLPYENFNEPNQTIRQYRSALFNLKYGIDRVDDTLCPVCTINGCPIDMRTGYPIWSLV
jgi:hypothetical protein